MLNTEQYWRCVCLMSGVKYYDVMDKQWHNCYETAYDTYETDDLMFLEEAESDSEVVEFKTNLMKELEIMHHHVPKRELVHFLGKEYIGYEYDYRNASFRFVMESYDYDEE